MYHNLWDASTAVFGRKCLAFNFNIRNVENAEYNIIASY